MRVTLLLLAALLTACAMVQADDLRFGFDTDKDGDGLPGKWRLGKATDPKGVAIDQADKKSGAASIRLNDTSEWHYVVIHRNVSVKPNTTYRLKAWAKTARTTGATCIYISEYHAPGKGRGLLKLHVLIMEQPRDWKEFEKEFSTTEKTGVIRIELCPIGFACMHTGTAWIDDVRVEEVK